MEVKEKNYASPGVANTAIALAATALGTQLLGGNLGNLLGGNNLPPPGEPPWSRDMNYERELTKANAENGQLKAQIYCDDKVDALRRELQAATAAQQVFNATMSAAVATTTQQTQQLMQMTGLFIKQPVMAASTAALNYNLPTASAASTTSTATGTGA